MDGSTEGGGLHAVDTMRRDEGSKNTCVLQRTLKSPINCTGTGLHSGQKVSMTLSPADPNTGVVFRRTDMSGKAAEIPALWNHVVETRLCTVIGNEAGATVGTIEHLAAALAGYGIDNALIEIDGPEVPIMDGSSEPFVFLLQCAGIVEQDAAKKAVEILKTVTVGDGEHFATLSPGRNFSMSYEIDFENQVIARQKYFFEHVNGAFMSELSRARTFGFEHEVARLRAAGLARGGSLDNAIVVGQDRILNEDGLRYDDEFVRHKVLDAIGDLYLAGRMILGHFHGYRAGHALNNQLLGAMFADPESHRIVSLDDRPDLVLAKVETGIELAASA